MSILNQTEPHYIRCIKPNHNKSSTEFNSLMSLEQLTYSGVFEAVAIRKQGFPFRLAHQKFATHYESITNGQGSTIKEKCNAIINELNLNQENVQIGKTQVLYRADEYKKLELIRSIKTAKIQIEENLKRLVKVNYKIKDNDKEDYMKALARAVREADDFNVETDVAEKARILLKNM